MEGTSIYCIFCYCINGKYQWKTGGGCQESRGRENLYICESNAAALQRDNYQWLSDNFCVCAYELPFLLGATTPKALPILAYQQYIHPNLENRPYAMALNGVIICISMVSAVLYFVMLKKNVSYLAGKNHEEKKKINT